MSFSWLPTHRAAQEALLRFAPRAGQRYASQRNYDHGPASRDNVSGLSPWLRHRLILEQEVLAATLARHRPESAASFVQEVYWRTYFKGWLEQHPDAWNGWLARLSADQARLDHDRALRERYVQAVSARTGLDCFDAWAEELVQTGYLHNHARMWFASIWIFTLQLPWSLGAAFFYEHLLDADPASNTLSWRWVGGLHTRGKHYLARADNIAKFTGGRFNPTGQLNTSAAALEEPEHERPVRIPLARAIHAPGADERVGVLVTMEDCSPASIPLVSAPVALAALPADAPVRGAYIAARGPAQRAFSQGAVAEGLAQAAAHFDLSPCTLDPDRVTDAMVRWVREQALQTVVTPFVPVGPTRSVLDAVADQLQAAGARLVPLQRHYDSLAWPHAKAGFFGLKKKIPALLDALA